ncbi:MAG: hypothetical protein U9N46_03190, partial [Euryarchaeota archaeon]|nr:hypothetical protein [Euryarchaeota archaeon]
RLHRNTPKKYLNGTISHIHYKKARDVFCKCTKNTGDAAAMLPVEYHGADGGLIGENMPLGRYGCCVRKKSRGRLLQISIKRRRASFQRETSMKRTRGIVAAIVRICSGWLISILCHISSLPPSFIVVSAFFNYFDTIP